MKKVLSVEEYIPGTLIIKLEATKRIKMWVKILKEIPANPICDPSICPLYYTCTSIPSPLKKYPNFGEFCNKLFSNYPDLAFKLATEYGVTNINQVVPIKMKI